MPFCRCVMPGDFFLHFNRVGKTSTRGLHARYQLASSLTAGQNGAPHVQKPNANAADSFRGRGLAGLRHCQRDRSAEQRGDDLAIRAPGRTAAWRCRHSLQGATRAAELAQTAAYFSSSNLSPDAPDLSSLRWRATASCSQVDAICSSCWRCAGGAVRAISRHSAACSRYSCNFLTQQPSPPSPHIMSFRPIRSRPGRENSIHRGVSAACRSGRFRGPGRSTASRIWCSRRGSGPAARGRRARPI